MIHVMNYTTQSSWDLACDDWRSLAPDSMADYAWPTVARVTSEPSEAWIARCRSDIEEELRGMDFDPDRMEGERELAALTKWKASVTFTGSYWDYEHGSIHPNAKGEFQYRVPSGASKTHTTLAAAEEALFYEVVLPALDIPVVEPEFTWSVEEHRHPDDTIHHQHTCKVGEEIAALMIVRQLEDERV